MINFIKHWRTFIFQFRIQQTVQWWEAKQQLRLKRQADRVWDELMQDLFTIRRAIELLPHHSGIETHPLLERVESMHRTLEVLNEALFPPYVDDSLPLALQHFTKRQQRSGLQFELELPEQWIHSSASQNYTIVLVLEELVPLVSFNRHEGRSLQLTLTSEHYQGVLQGVLMVQVTYSEPSVVASIQSSEEIIYLGRAFQLLTSGWYLQEQYSNVGLWQLRWRSPAHLPGAPPLEQHHE